MSNLCCMYVAFMLRLCLHGMLQLVDEALPADHSEGADDEAVEERSHENREGLTTTTTTSKQKRLTRDESQRHGVEFNKEFSEFDGPAADDPPASPKRPPRRSKHKGSSRLAATSTVSATEDSATERLQPHEHVSAAAHRANRDEMQRTADRLGHHPQ